MDTVVFGGQSITFKFYFRLNYSSRTILDKEAEPEENSNECEDEDQEEVHVDVNNEIIETWMIHGQIWPKIQ